MNIRALEMEDVEELRKIHEKFYEQEFSFPDFRDKYLCNFCVVNGDNSIITGGGIRTILESVIITNKDYSVKERREALYKILQASLFAMGRLEYSELHAFIQDEDWLKHLKRVGFRETKGKSLVLGF